MSLFGHPCGVISIIAHVIQCASSFIVLGITAWAVRDTKTLTVIFCLVVVHLSHQVLIYRNSKIIIGGPHSSLLRHNSQHQLHYQRPQMARFPSACD